MKVIGLGAGGHAKVVIELLRANGEYDVVGLLDPQKIGQTWLGVPVLGGDDQLPGLRAQGISHAFIGVGGSGDNAPRARLYHLAVTAGFSLVNALHPAAVLSPSARFGQGVTVMAGVIINADVTIGDDVIINTGAIVEHDCQIGNHAHISSGAVLAGGVTVGAYAHIGAGATVRQSITVGEGALVGAGAAVVQDVPARAVVVGVPARILRYDTATRAEA
jgi:UDP-perosamine 4-acetyltransferase